MDANKLKIYPFFKSCLDLFWRMGQSTGQDPLLLNKAIEEVVKSNDFTTVGLYGQPRFYAGTKKVTGYYLDYDEQTEVFSNPAVMKTFTDYTAPNYWKLECATVSGDLVTVAQDRTAVIEVGDVHIVLDGTNPTIMKALLTVSAVSFNGTNTEVTYSGTMGTTSASDILRFAKGQRLGGFEILFEWYDNDGNVLYRKTENHDMTAAQAEDFERKRRERSISHMISNARSTDIEEIVLILVDHYSPEIKNYKELGMANEFANAIDNETDPTILFYLSIQIPVINELFQIEKKTLGQAMKDGLYYGYE